MKKILAIMAAACAMSAFADLTTQETFEGFEVDSTFNPNADNIAPYWSCESDPEDLFSIVATDGDYAAECGYPAAKSTHDKALKIDGASKDNPLYYYPEARDDHGNPQLVDIGQGIYLDTMVNFTVTDEIDQPVADGSKLALFLYSAEDSDTTNLIFRAGYYNSTDNDIIPTNYVMKGSVEAGKWYRLTVKAIKIGATKDYYGFVPYLDGQVLEYDAAETAGVEGSVIDELSSVATKYYTPDKKSLLPSLSKGTDRAQITSCGFVGTGLVDDLTFTDVAPAFAADATSVTITWGEGVASVTVDDKTIEGESPFVMELPAGKTTIMVTAKAAEGYVLDGWTDGEKPVKSGDTIEINAFQPAFQVGDTYFPADEINDAVDAAIAAGATLKLLAPCTESIYVSGGTLVLDLAGQTIATTELCDGTIYLDNANIEIINSTTQVGHIAAAPEEGPAIYCDGDCCATIRGGIIDGAIDGSAIFFGGSVIKLEDDFPFELGDKTLTVSEQNGYWVIKQAGGDDPWQDVEEGQIEDVTEENKEAVVATLETIKTALAGDEAAVGKWITTVYGNEKVPAATVAAAKNVEISVKYDLPLMTAEKPTIEIKQAVDDETAEPIEGFTFQIKDAGNPVSLAAAVEKIQSMVQFTADLEKAFDASEATDVKVGLSEDKKTATATFTKATAAGFMKVELK